MAGGGTYFDLSKIDGSWAPRTRLPPPVAIVVAVAFVILWGIAVLPGYFQAPHVLHVCSKGVCNDAPPSDYYQLLDFYTLLIFAFSGVLIAIALYPRFRQRPTAALVRSSGFTIEWGAGKPKTIEWSDLPFCCLENQNEARAERKQVGALVKAHYSVRTNFWSANLSEEAFKAILGSARGAGLFCESIRFGENLTYRIWPLDKESRPETTS